MRWLAIGTVMVVGYLAYVWRDRFEPDSLRGKRVLITGASTGIGEQLAYSYAKLGANLLVTARRENRLKEVVNRCQEVGNLNGEYYYHPADMSDVNSYEQVIKAAVEKLGGLDYLVLNHINAVPFSVWLGSAHNLTLLQETFDINFRAYTHLASHALSPLQSSHGSIIVVSSIAGRLPQPYLISYSATKFALDGFFSGLRQEIIMQEKDISITLCILGLIGTDSAKERIEDFGSDFMNNLRASSPTEAAVQVIKAGALREREMFFPYLEAKFSTTLRALIPDIMDAIVRTAYKQG